MGPSQAGLLGALLLVVSAGAGYEVVHVDDHVVVVCKDGGLLTVPASYGGPCLVDLLDARFFGRHRLAVVHRLDRETSGLLVFARAPEVAAKLAKQFAAHRVDREYVAILAGALPEDRGTITAKVDGKRAVTHFTVTARHADATSVAVRLETGRRNQIRVHFKERGHPVVGDAPHPAWPHTRIALHARVLGFEHPVLKRRLIFEASVPDAFQAFTRRDGR